MTLIAMLSAKGSPGVSTAALACTLTWPAPVLLAECDPAGGALLAGHLSRYDVPADRGILPLAGAALRNTAVQDLASQVIDLDSGKRERMALPGLTDPAQGAVLEPAWEALGEFFAGLGRSTLGPRPAGHTAGSQAAGSPGAGPIVIADCGRLATAYVPWALLRRADVVLLAVRPTSVSTVSPAVPAIASLRRELAETPAVLGLMLIGGGLPAREISRHLMLPVIAQIAWDPRTASALNGDGHGRRRGPLMRSAGAAFRLVESARTGAIASRETVIR
jgi:hypothetical protein